MVVRIDSTNLQTVVAICHGRENVAARGNPNKEIRATPNWCALG